MTFGDPTRYGRRGMVCTVDHLASATGLTVLAEGGTAADAAVAASAVLAVTTQHMCGAGGDLLAVVHDPAGADRALLAVGRAGSGADAAAMRAEGLRRVPFRGDVRAVTVPGCVDGWLALHVAYGRLPLERVLAPAVHYAHEGFPVAPLLAAALPGVAEVPGADELVGSGLPRAGDLVRRPRLGAALAAIAREGRAAWYGGAFGAGLLRVGGGLFEPADLERDLAEWTSPVRLQVGDDELLSTPTPTQGYLVLSSAWLADRVGAFDSEHPHLLVEAARAAGYDRDRRLGEGVGDLLHEDDLRRRLALVDPDRARRLPVPAAGGGTINLATADADGMVISLSQSNAAGFGAHLTVPEVGVFLHNRGIGFSLDPSSPAHLEPGRRPMHTLCPSLLRSRGATTAIGTMGGDAQPQILLQLLDALRRGATPGAALARPRWALVGPAETGFDQWEPWPDGAVAPALALEAAAPDAWVEGLERRGHRTQRVDRAFGHAHLLTRRVDGMLAGAADPRAVTGDAQAF